MALAFHTTDAQGAPIDIPAGSPFTTYWVVADGQTQAMEVNHPWNALDVYSPDDLARFTITTTTVPDPPLPRAELPKSTVIARLNTIGKLTPVWTVLQSNPLAFSQWFAPDWPNVYCDDAGMLAIFGAAGLSAGEIATVTAHG